MARRLARYRPNRKAHWYDVNTGFEKNYQLNKNQNNLDKAATAEDLSQSN